MPDDPGRTRTRARASQKKQTRVMPPPKATKLTLDLQYQICQLVAAGAPLPLACPAAGISWRTVEEWMSSERADQEPYASFQAAVDKARGMHAVGAALRITKAGQRGAWQADLAILERRYGRYYGKPRLSDLGNTDGADAPIALGAGDDQDRAPLSDAELEAIIRAG